MLYRREIYGSEKEEMALVMLINKIQNPDGWKKFTEEAKEFVNMVYEKAPEEIKQIIKEGVLGNGLEAIVPRGVLACIYQNPETCTPKFHRQRRFY